MSKKIGLSIMIPFLAFMVFFIFQPNAVSECPNVTSTETNNPSDQECFHISMTFSPAGEEVTPDSEQTKEIDITVISKYDEPFIWEVDGIGFELDYTGDDGGFNNVLLVSPDACGTAEITVKKKITINNEEKTIECSKIIRSSKGYWCHIEEEDCGCHCPYLASRPYVNCTIGKYRYATRICVACTNDPDKICIHCDNCDCSCEDTPCPNRDEDMIEGCQGAGWPGTTAFTYCRTISYHKYVWLCSGETCENN